MATSHQLEILSTRMDDLIKVATKQELESSATDYLLDIKSDPPKAYIGKDAYILLDLHTMPKELQEYIYTKTGRDRSLNNWFTSKSLQYFRKYYRFEYHQSKFDEIDDAGDLLDNTLDSFPEIEMILNSVQKKASKYSLAIQYMGKVIPINAKVIYAGRSQYRAESISIEYTLVDMNNRVIEEENFYLYSETYKQSIKGLEEGPTQWPKITLRQALEHTSLTIINKSQTTSYWELFPEARKLCNQVGLAIQYTGISSFLPEKTDKYWFINEVSIFTEEHQTQGVVEPELEQKQRSSNIATVLPVIRFFDLKAKIFKYGWVEGIEKRQFYSNLDQLVLEERNKKLLLALMESKQVYKKDFNQHQKPATIILAQGPPGTGKTATAQQIAEKYEKVIYTLETFELGNNLSTIELNLSKVMQRVKRWDAILLFDEADIYLQERDAHDLTRSAIVGVFLRVFDTFPGYIFLTTNRVEVLEGALRNRLSLNLKFNDLGEGQRSHIWLTYKKLLDLNLSNEALESLANLPLNGREIRNKANLLKTLYGNELLTPEICLELCY